MITLICALFVLLPPTGMIAHAGPALLRPAPADSVPSNSIQQRNIPWESYNRDKLTQQRDQLEGPVERRRKQLSGWNRFMDKLFGDPSDLLANDSQSLSSQNLEDQTVNRRVGGRDYLDENEGPWRYRREDNPLSMPVVLLFLVIVAVCIAVVVLEANYNILQDMFRVVEDDNDSIEERLARYDHESSKNRTRRKSSKQRKRNKRSSGRRAQKWTSSEEDEDEKEEDSEYRYRHGRKQRNNHHKPSCKSSSSRRSSDDREDDSSLT